MRSSPACTAITKEDPQFGVAEFRSGTGEACGVAEYISKPDQACGLDREEFWSDWDRSCPSGYASSSWFSALGNTETRIHRVSWTDIRVQTRHLCLRVTPKTCALPQFGVKQFNNCRDASFGVERYNSGVVGYETCRDENHGVESYNSCRHETFGVETHKTCSLYMTQPELEGYLRAQSDVLPALSGSVIDSAAIYYSSAGKQKALACLVKEIDEAHCADNDVGITCTALRSFRKAHRALLTTRQNLMLLSREAHERGNAASTEALNDLLRAVR